MENNLMLNGFLNIINKKMESNGLGINDQSGTKPVLAANILSALMREKVKIFQVVDFVDHHLMNNKILMKKIF